MRDNLSNPADNLQDGPQEAAEFIADVPSQPSIPVNDRIAQRAYELYQARGSADGAAWTDWLQAEAEVNAALGTAESDEANTGAAEERGVQTGAASAARS